MGFELKCRLVKKKQANLDEDRTLKGVDRLSIW